MENLLEKLQSIELKRIYDRTGVLGGNPLAEAQATLDAAILALGGKKPALVEKPADIVVEPGPAPIKKALTAE